MRRVHAVALLAAALFGGAPGRSVASTPASAGDVLYVTSSFDGTILRFTPDGVGVAAATVSGFHPWGFAFDPAGNLYVGVAGTNTIEKFTPAGDHSVFATTDVHPTGLACDASGNVYVAISLSHHVVRYTPEGVGTVFVSEGLNWPTGLLFDDVGNLYVANGNGNSISRFSPTGVSLGVYASSGGASPYGLAFDAEGNLFVANNGSDTVWKITPAGVGSLFCTTNSAYGVAVGPDGTVYVSRNEEDDIQRYSSAGVLLETFADATDGLDSPLFLAFRSEAGQAPVADAGPDRSVHAGDPVTLDGSGSTDDDTASADLVHAWTLTTRPAGSTASLSGAGGMTPSFTADATGTYVVSLTVTDGNGLTSAADSVTISSVNLAPTADAGVDLVAEVDLPVALAGAAIDPEGDALTYSWEITSAPPGSTATLADATTLAPSLTPDVTGTYVLSLVASDPYDDSAPDTMTLSVVAGNDDPLETIQAASSAVAGFPGSAFDSPGHRVALSALLVNAVKDLGKGKTAAAVEKLTSVVLRTDGCPLRGAPDGPGPGRDWVVDCDAAGELHALLQAALEALLP